MRNTTAIVVLSGALLTAGWGLAAGYTLRPFIKAWFAAAAAGAPPSAEPSFRPALVAHSRIIGRDHYQAERCPGDYVCDEPASLVATPAAD
jgi:hypothetical protein